EVIGRGPVAAVLPIKHFGTNGGGFFGANSAHPFENPAAWTNVFECFSFLVFPFALVVTFGRMLQNVRHAVVIYGVMMVMFAGMIGWAIATDTLQPNPGLTDRPALTDAHGKPLTVTGLDKDATPVPKEVPAPALVGLPVDQTGLGNLEGKELRYGLSAGPTFAAMTTAVTCGSVNCMHDSLNPLTGLTPLTG